MQFQHKTTSDMRLIFRIPPASKLKPKVVGRSHADARHFWWKSYAPLSVRERAYARSRSSWGPLCDEFRPFGIAVTEAGSVIRFPSRHRTASAPRHSCGR